MMAKYATESVSDPASGEKQLLPLEVLANCELFRSIGAISEATSKTGEPLIHPMKHHINQHIRR
jgi:hypothetical protein